MKSPGLQRILVNAGLGAIALIFLYPIIWMVLAGFRSNAEIFSTRSIWPERWHATYYEALFANEHFDFGRAFGNSLLIATAQSFGATVLAALAGFVVASARLWQRRIAILAALGLVMISPQVISLPMLVWINRVGLFDHALGVILPGLASGLGLLYFVRVWSKVPRELSEAARAEGATEWMIFRILIPLVRSQLLVLGFLLFVLAWHAHLIPLLILQSEDQRTLPLQLAALYGGSFHPPQAILMAAATIGLLPLLVLFAWGGPLFRTAAKDFVSA